MNFIINFKKLLITFVKENRKTMDKEEIKKHQDAIKEYQCTGCLNGPTMTCLSRADYGDGCGKHVPGTHLGLNTIFLGLPNGFNRTVTVDGDYTPVNLFLSFKGDEYDVFNVPVWKHLNEKGHTIVRGLQPRVNRPFIHIFLEDCMDFIDCKEITDFDIDLMD